MQPQEQKRAARDFVAFWTGKGYEKGQTQPFWLSLLRVLGVERPETFIEFEDKAHIDAAHGFIDGYLPATRVLVEQKSLGKDLRATFMPPDLRKAHQENDRAVMAAYGFPVKTTESECVAELFRRYRALAARKGAKA